MPRKAKKNAQGAGDIRKRSDGRWEARYTVGLDPVTGRQIQKSIYGKTQKEVRERLAAGPAWNNADDLVFTDELGHHLKHVPNIFRAKLPT